MNVINFADKQQQKQRAAQYKEGEKEMLRILQLATKEEQNDIFTALETGDKQLFKEVTRPIILRNIVQE